MASMSIQSINQPAQVVQLNLARLLVLDVAELRRDAALADTGKQLALTYRGLADAAYEVTRVVRQLGASVDTDSQHIPKANLDFRVACLYLETHPRLRHTFFALKASTRVGATVTPQEFYHGDHGCQVKTPQLLNHFSMLSNIGLLIRMPGQSDQWQAPHRVTKLAGLVLKHLKAQGS